MIRRSIFLFVLILWTYVGYGQVATTQLDVGGNFDKFYPVVFKDSNFKKHLPTIIEIGRSDTHLDGPWRGTVIANFKIHTYAWGHASNFVEAEIYQFNSRQEVEPFVAGYRDATLSSGGLDFIVWLRGNSTYYYTSNVIQAPRVYDNIQNMLPFQEQNGGTHTFKTTIDKTLNSKGKTSTGSLHLLGNSASYFAGNVGIGTLTPAEKLAVNGNIRAKEIKVEAGPWPDYVFEEDYNLKSLSELEQFVKKNKHLPGVPKATEVEDAGVSLGEMNRILLQKVEELTLHLITLDKSYGALKMTNDQLKRELLELKEIVKSK